MKKFTLEIATLSGIVSLLALLVPIAYGVTIGTASVPITSSVLAVFGLSMLFARAAVMGEVWYMLNNGAGALLWLYIACVSA